MNRRVTKRDVLRKVTCSTGLSVRILTSFTAEVDALRDWLLACGKGKPLATNPAFLKRRRRKMGAQAIISTILAG